MTDEPTYRRNRARHHAFDCGGGRGDGTSREIRGTTEPKGDYWVKVAPAFELARLIKQGRQTKFFIDHIGEDRLEPVEVLLGPYMDLA